MKMENTHWILDNGVQESRKNKISMWFSYETLEARKWWVVAGIEELAKRMANSSITLNCMDKKKCQDSQDTKEYLLFIYPTERIFM